MRSPSHEDETRGTSPPVLTQTHVRRTDAASVLPPMWRVMRDAPADGVRNMAVDAALMDRARETGESVWRCYAWTTPTISFGRHESIAGRYDAASVARAGLDAVRRPTGGRALLHGREVTYSATLPLASGTSWRDAYAAINGILLDALHRLGVPATIADTSPTVPLDRDATPCFDRPAAGEIVIGTAKLVGSAVWRSDGAYLQHGSILLHDDQALLARAMMDGAAHALAATPPPPAATLHEYFATSGSRCPTWDVVAEALERALAARADVAPLWFDAKLRDASARCAEQSERPDWLWRR